MSRNVLYLVIAVLVIIAGVAGYLLYQEQQKPGVSIEIGEGGVSIEGK
jgi:predicted negative regulator of RcsB-dependent stress response